MRWWLFFVISSILLCSDAEAVVLRVTDIQYGSIIRDTATGFEWIPFSFTIGKSYNEVSAGFVEGGSFSTLKYATSSEVIDLWKDFGITDINIRPSIANTASVAKFQEYFGVTGTSGNYSITQALVSSYYNSGRAIAGTGFTTSFPGSGGQVGAWAEVPNSAMLDSARSFSVASYLRRDATPTPEPGSLGLLALGSFGLFFRRGYIKSAFKR